jgi:hypothetical protein
VQGDYQRQIERRSTIQSNDMVKDYPDEPGKPMVQDQQLALHLVQPNIRRWLQRRTKVGRVLLH